MPTLRHLIESAPGAAWLVNRKLTFNILQRHLRAPAESAPKIFSPNLLYVAASCLPYHVSGYTTRTQEILQALRQAELPFRVMTRPGYPWDRKDRLLTPESESCKHNGISYQHYPTPDNKRLLMQYAPRAARVIAEHAVKVKASRIHAASNHTNAIPALLAARKLGLPFQYEMRGLWELSRASRQPGFSGSAGWRLGLDLEGFVAQNADQLFVISGQLANFAHRHWGIPEDKIKILPNCVELDELPQNPAQADLIGYSGSLVAYEGLDLLLRAIALLKSQGLSLRLRVIGDGEAKESLQRLARDLGIESQVNFTGRMPLEKAREALSEAALVCIPRLPYAVCGIIPPIKLVEAMALGKPVVAPDLPVFREELGELAPGRLFEAGNVEALAHLLREKIGDANLAAEGAHLRERALAKRRWRYFVPHLLPEA